MILQKNIFLQLVGVVRLLSLLGLPCFDVPLNALKVQKRPLYLLLLFIEEVLLFLGMKGRVTLTVGLYVMRSVIEEVGFLQFSRLLFGKGIRIERE